MASNGNVPSTENNDESNDSTSTTSSATANQTNARLKLEYLLKQSEMFTRFISTATKPKSPKKSGRPARNVKTNVTKAADRRHRITEKEEDAELINLCNSKEVSNLFSFESSPEYIKNGAMRDYQIRGLNWMITLYENGISGILADEMGLGKTLQTISMLGYLKNIKKINGPHIIIVPKSTVQNWLNEFKKWCPSIKPISFVGNKEERKVFVQNSLFNNDWDVLITYYEICLLESAVLKKIKWKYLVIDEAHRIKNEKSRLSEMVRKLDNNHRLLLTGTPLQNNLHELWALLNFLLPDVFNSSDDFDSWFNTSEFMDDTSLIQRLHTILKPFLLRRIKAEVEKSLLPKKELYIYVGLTKMQREWYTNILTKDISILNGFGSMQKTTLQNIVMHLRKCCNHPYLFDGAEPGPPYTTDEHIVKNCGKMIVLDKLLPKLKAQGSRVLIFSLMVRMLDILEDYFIWRNFKYCRIDGNTNYDERNQQIDDYNAEGSDKFIFMLSTRAGGLGINLATADYVIIYDSDWNPQVDLQAMDRAHRIGQKKQVHVLRFTTENTVEEKVIERAEMKLRLDKIVIQQGRLTDNKLNRVGKDDMLKMIQFGANKIFATKGDDSILDDDIDTILKHGDQRTTEQKQILDKLGEGSLRLLSLDVPSGSVYQFEGEDYRDKQKKILENWIGPPKRDRKVCNYGGDGIYKTVQKEPKPRTFKPPRQVLIQDFQFYPKRFCELYKKEEDYYRKQLNFKYPSRTELGPEAEAQRKIDQKCIDTAEPLTEIEIAEKEKLAAKAFSKWNKRDFRQLIKAIEKFGHEDTQNICKSIDGKTETEVQEYIKIFWERFDELNDAEYIRLLIKRTENQKKRLIFLMKLIAEKMENSKNPYYDMKFKSTNRKRYSEDDDRFLLCTLHSIGLDKENVYDELRNAVRSAPQMRFNFYLKTLTAHQLQRRCSILLSSLEREYLENEEKSALEKKRKNINQQISSVLTNIDQENMTQKRKADSDLNIENGMAAASKKMKN